MAGKLPIHATVKINAYRAIEDAVERGADFGVRRAHKHTDHPTHEAIAAEVVREVMNALCEVLSFDEGGGE